MLRGDRRVPPERELDCGRPNTHELDVVEKPLGRGGYGFISRVVLVSGCCVVRAPWEVGRGPAVAGWDEEEVQGQ